MLVIFLLFCALSASVLSNSATAQGRVILFDLGSPRQLSPENWNNITKPERTGMLLKHAVDSTGAPTTVSLYQIDGWSGFNDNGYRGEDPYPSKSMRDSFYLEGKKDRSAKIRISGLVPGHEYSFTFFASRMGGTHKRTAHYRIGDRVARLNASDNVATRIRITNVASDRQGDVTILIECPAGEQYAYLGVLEISGRFPRRLEIKEPSDLLVGPPFVTSEAWAVADGKTGEVLWGFRDSEPLEIASTTKIMTAWIVLDLAVEDLKVLDEVVTVSKNADNIKGTTADLRAGERLSVRDLLYGLLLPSGNDAAVALGEHLGNRLPVAGGSTRGGDTIVHFVAEMNSRAQSLKMFQAKFSDPHGKSRNRASASGLVRLAWRAMQNPLFRRYVRTHRHQATIKRPDGSERVIVWKNTNELLQITGYDGVKTGTTAGAGACLVASGRRGSDHLLVAVLGAKSIAGRYADTRNLFRWAWLERGHKARSAKNAEP